MIPALEMNSLSRREAIARAAAAMGLGGAVLAGSGAAMPGIALGRPGAGARKRVLRLAHLTDMHVQPERRAGEGFAAALRHVQSHGDRPELIVTGGDLIMDCFAADEARTRAQWDLWSRLLREECSLPLEHCIGNHDIWGWNQEKSGTSGREAMYGHAWALDVLGLASRYRAFDRAGWRFVVLDSTFRVGNTYTARLDEEQFEWLSRTLAETPRSRPVLVLSHIPILSASAFFDGECEKDGDWKVPGSWMHIDARRIKDLFFRHPNVRLCLSGHIHLVDRVDYLGVTYLCNGAVSGAWWKGSNQECEAGYCIVDLYDDGSFEHAYIGFGWAGVPD
ncbi:MAG: metallophosphoesterase [Phycisphaeraceae bacterium]|nr:metallophosphoesterase [Phycisphaeraceae bacterium]